MCPLRMTRRDPRGERTSPFLEELRGFHKQMANHLSCDNLFSEHSMLSRGITQNSTPEGVTSATELGALFWIRE